MQEMNLQDGTGLRGRVLTPRVGLQSKRRDLEPDGAVVPNLKIGLEIKGTVLIIGF